MLSRPDRPKPEPTTPMLPPEAPMPPNASWVANPNGRAVGVAVSMEDRGATGGVGDEAGRAAAASVPSPCARRC
eukprot:scaffold4145_cov115-Isochrysis_galbana.AAC.8